ncbi:hypothetical protein SARC_08299 [Sphaeroforma arctica JP610]|uniref:Mediator of RNA polymerase II transcription subunit 31 n=1 Tax=Sphaeroforma arctica JP610 TaxID=667725 RepID=A0A0L0FRI6_9EUKA|nr:hypothetical protein SARC_08299 [Sphaeroforma arctica JP610]KNC79304.1 hypothetical protein SARC_08299 [Sphaeroforma arctica JP610]|eukprot:XP_014153206.1 hypothetical protein SARC_08299 [Sphaeroforma arctica JP610]
MAVPSLDETSIQVRFDAVGDTGRFEIELEFVQSLGDPSYLNWLAQQRILQQPEFVNYLEYLTYWRTPEYAKFIAFPHCLHFLDLLQHKPFRDAVINNEIRDELLQQYYLHWKSYYPGMAPNTSTDTPTTETTTDVAMTNGHTEQSAMNGDMAHAP